MVKLTSIFQENENHDSYFNIYKIFFVYHSGLDPQTKISCWAPVKPCSSNTLCEMCAHNLCWNSTCPVVYVVT